MLIFRTIRKQLVVSLLETGPGKVFPSLSFDTVAQTALDQSILLLPLCGALRASPLTLSVH